MRSSLHNQDPQQVLSKHLKAVLAKRGLSVRKIERELKKRAVKTSNRTIQNMVNGTGNPGLANIMLVAEYLKLPLWQLLSPTLDPSHLTDEFLQQMLELAVPLNELGRKRVLRAIRGEVRLQEEEDDVGPSTAEIAS